MGKAASKEAMQRLHSKVALVFERVLETYAKRLDAIESVDMDQLEDDMLQELFNEGAIPNPAMLNAVTAFLKNNEIKFDSEEVGRVSALQEALEDRRKQRSNVTSLTSLKVVGDE